MSSVEVSAIRARAESPTSGLWLQGLVAAAFWLAAALLIVYLPNATRTWPMTQGLANVCLAVTGLIVLAVIVARWSQRLSARTRHLGPWLIALPVVLSLWELLTAKLAWLPVPFFAPPQALLDVYVEDWPRLADSLFHSAILLGSGVALGANASASRGRDRSESSRRQATPLSLSSASSSASSAPSSLGREP